MTSIITSITAPVARAAAFLVLVAAGSIPASATDAVFPPGARIGLVPAEGLTVARDFLGFETDDQKVKVGVAEIPPAAFTAVEAAVKEGKTTTAGSRPEAFDTKAGKGFITTEASKDGAVGVKMYSVIVSGSDTYAAYVIAQARDDAAKPVSDADMRKMLATLTLRDTVPVDEQLSLLPFKVTELGNFKTVRTLMPRSSVLLTDGTENNTLDGAPYMVIGLVNGSPEGNDDRARFAEQAATSIPGLRNVRVTGNEPIRIGGIPSFETRIEAVTGKSDTPVTLVQWLRFGSSTSLRIIASATREDWSGAFPRFRAVRDGIDPR